MSVKTHNSLKKTPSHPAHWHVYILRCADKTLYTGVAKDISLRLFQHNSGRGAKYTRGRRPVTLVYQETVADYGSALRREYEIKQMTSQAKKKLVATHQVVQKGPYARPQERGNRNVQS